jgi:hypothetical protein
VVKASNDSNVAAKVAAAAVASVALFGQVQAAQADIAGLTPCSESKAYAKRLKNEVKGLNKRLKGVSDRSRKPPLCCPRSNRPRGSRSR